MPGSGKTTRLKLILNKFVAENIEFEEKFAGDFVNGYQVHVFDKRGEFDEICGLDVKTFEVAKTLNWPFVRYRNPVAALRAARMRGGVLVLEELMLVEREHYKEIREISVSRRHDDEGRAEPLSIMGVSQRPHWIPKEMLDLSDYIYVFKMVSQADINCLSHLLPKKKLEQIPKLRVGEYFLVDPSKAE